jgi:hypothetical protein
MYATTSMNHGNEVHSDSARRQDAHSCDFQLQSQNKCQRKDDSGSLTLREERHVEVQNTLAKTLASISSYQDLHLWKSSLFPYLDLLSTTSIGTINHAWKHYAAAHLQMLKQGHIMIKDMMERENKKDAKKIEEWDSCQGVDYYAFHDSGPSQHLQPFLSSSAGCELVALGFLRLDEFVKENGLMNKQRAAQLAEDAVRVLHHIRNKEVTIALFCESGGLMRRALAYSTLYPNDLETFWNDDPAIRMNAFKNAQQHYYCLCSAKNEEFIKKREQWRDNEIKNLPANPYCLYFWRSKTEEWEYLYAYDESWYRTHSFSKPSTTQHVLPHQNAAMIMQRIHCGDLHQIFHMHYRASELGDARAVETKKYEMYNRCV